MATSRRQLCALLAVCCAAASAPVWSDSISPQDFPVTAEIAGEACRFTDPTDPHQILGPNPAHADCLAALYPSAIASGAFADRGTPLGEVVGTAASPASVSLHTTFWLTLTTLAMLVLAGFNSRKRHRQLPAPGLDGTFSRPPETLHTHSEGSRWNEDQ